mmetsp:Transcript_9473/g.24046  ORF Transcript_9473/g.24046 Transcript_9473/m.24046 type:complete len:526 (-) Transcript_9473:247-1824(-)
MLHRRFRRRQQTFRRWNGRGGGGKCSKILSIQLRHVVAFDFCTCSVSTMQRDVKILHDGIWRRLRCEFVVKVKKSDGTPRRIQLRFARLLARFIGDGMMHLHIVFEWKSRIQQRVVRGSICCGTGWQAGIRRIRYEHTELNFGSSSVVESHDCYHILFQHGAAECPDDEARGCAWGEVLAARLLRIRRAHNLCRTHPQMAWDAVAWNEARHEHASSRQIVRMLALSHSLEAFLVEPFKLLVAYWQRVTAICLHLHRLVDRHDSRRRRGIAGVRARSLRSRKSLRIAGLRSVILRKEVVILVFPLLSHFLKGALGWHVCCNWHQSWRQWRRRHRGWFACWRSRQLQLDVLRVPFDVRVTTSWNSLLLRLVVHRHVHRHPATTSYAQLVYFALVRLHWLGFQLIQTHRAHFRDVACVPHDKLGAGQAVQRLRKCPRTPYASVRRRPFPTLVVRVDGNELDILHDVLVDKISNVFRIPAFSSFVVQSARQWREHGNVRLSGFCFFRELCSSDIARDGERLQPVCSLST